MNLSFLHKTPQSINYENTLMNYFNEFNRKYPDIDNGGCGTFSYHVSNLLDSYGIKNEIVYAEEKEVPDGAYRCDVKFEHILIKTEKFVIDNNGVYDLNSDYVKRLKYLKKRKLRKMINDERLWNDKFNHETDKIKLIKDIYKIKL